MKIAFLGDSITLGYGLTDRNQRYSTIVSHNLKMEEQNLGITGTLMAQAGLNRNDKNDFVSRAHLIDAADFVVVFGGTNDYFWSDCGIYGENESCFQYAVRKLIEKILLNRDKQSVVFVTPYRHNGVGNYENGKDWLDSNRHDTDTKNYNGHTLKDYVDVIAALCREYGVPCLNLYEKTDFDWKEHTIDGCHPNEMGHKIIAAHIEDAIRAALLS
jgi:lysophospholipase L1-like esterase